MDVKNIFFYNELSKEVYMQPPPNLSHPSDIASHLYEYQRVEMVRLTSMLDSLWAEFKLKY